MRIARRMLSIMMAVITAFSVMSISAEALSVVVKKNRDYGFMIPVNYKGTERLSTVKVYGQYDYINFYITSNESKKVYFIYEIYSDKKLTKCVQSDAVEVEGKGSYNYNLKLKLKGNFKTKTYYVVTYAAKYSLSKDKFVVDGESIYQFKLKVDRTTSFSKQKVMLKETKNTTKGAYIKWSKLSGTDKYNIYRRNITGSKWKKVGSVSKSKNSFTDTSVKNKNGNYIYTVKAVNKKGTVSRYHYAGLVCLFAETPALESASVIYNNYIEIEWEKTSGKAKYNIMRKEGNGSWKTIKKNYSETSYTDKTAKPGKKYTYSVKAVISTDYGKATSSYYANDNKAITLLGAPELNNVTVAENGVKVTWKSVEGVSGYTVMRRPLNKSEGWTILGAVDAEALEFIDTTADLEYSYIYTVRSVSAESGDSYYSSGVNYHNLKKPEITSTGIYSYNDYHSISWEKVEYATEYYLYKKNLQGDWELLDTFDATDGDTQTVRVEPEKYALTEYCVQAGYNNTLKSELSDSAFIDEYPYSKYFTENRVEYNYVKILVNQKADRYNVYKIVESTGENELVATFDVAGEEFFEYKDYDFAEKSAYIVKGVFNGEEQSNFKAFSIVRGEEPAEARNESVYCESYSKTGFRVEITHPDYDGYYADYYFYNYATSKWVDVSSHYRNGNTHYIYEDNFPDDFECSSDGEYMLSIVYSKAGAYKPSAIDANIMTFKRFYAPIKNFTADAHKNGVKITWDAIDGVSKYIVNYTVEDVAKTVEIVADGSDKYSTVMEADINTTEHINYFPTITCEYTENSASRHGLPEIQQCGTPKISKTKYYSKTGMVVLYFGEHEGTACEYTIYRKEKGESSWKIVNEHAEDEVYSSKYGDGVRDRTAKPGKTYIYTLRASCRYESSEDLIYVRSYYDKEGKTCKT